MFPLFRPRAHTDCPPRLLLLPSTIYLNLFSSLVALKDGKKREQSLVVKQNENGNEYFPIGRSDASLSPSFRFLLQSSYLFFFFSLLLPLPLPLLRPARRPPLPPRPSPRLPRPPRAPDSTPAIRTLSLRYYFIFRSLIQKNKMKSIRSINEWEKGEMKICGGSTTTIGPNMLFYFFSFLLFLFSLIQSSLPFSFFLYFYYDNSIHYFYFSGPHFH